MKFLILLSMEIVTSDTLDMRKSLIPWEKGLKEKELREALFIADTMR